MVIRTNEKTEDIGIYSEQIHKFLDSLNKEQRESLTEKIKKFYPKLSTWDIMSKKFGWKKLFIIENYNGKDFRTNAELKMMVFLRIIAFLAQSLGKHNIINEAKK